MYVSPIAILFCLCGQTHAETTDFSRVLSNQACCAARTGRERELAARAACRPSLPFLASPPLKTEKKTSRFCRPPTETAFFFFFGWCVQGEGIPPDVVTTTILVKAQVGSGDVDAGARTLIEMMKSSSLKDQLDAFPFNTIIKVCVCLVCASFFCVFCVFVFAYINLCFCGEVWSLVVVPGFVLCRNALEVASTGGERFESCRFLSVN